MNYELNFLVLQSKTEQLPEIKEEVKKILENYQAKITDELHYKKRKLAYEIQHEHYGFYTVYRFDLDDGEKIKEIIRELNLNDKVARYVLVRSDELPELPHDLIQPKKTEQSSSVKQEGVNEDELLKKLTAQKQSLVSQKTKDSLAVGKTSKSKVENEQEMEEKKKKKKKKEVAEQEVKDKEKKSVEQEKKKENKDSASSTAQQKEVGEVDKEKREKKTDKTDEASKEEISIDELDKKLDEILDI